MLSFPIAQNEDCMQLAWSVACSLFWSTSQIARSLVVPSPQVRILQR